eukprot:g43869.t1
MVNTARVMLDCNLPMSPASLMPQSAIPVVNEFQRVPIAAYIRMAPKLSKKSLLGMKYPESSTMGGRRKRKKVSGSSWYSGFLAAARTIPPRPKPRKISKQLSGTTVVTLLERWNTGNEYTRK